MCIDVVASCVVVVRGVRCVSCVAGSVEFALCALRGVVVVVWRVVSAARCLSLGVYGAACVCVIGAFPCVVQVVLLYVLLSALVVRNQSLNTMSSSMCLTRHQKLPQPLKII